jgi:hypothetical protein
VEALAMTAPDGAAPRYQPREAVARALGLHERTLRRLERQLGIPVLRVGRQVRYDQVAIAALEDACRSKSGPEKVALAYGSPAPSLPPGRRKASGSDDVLAQMIADLQRKKHLRSKRRSSATTITGSAAEPGSGRRP